MQDGKETDKTISRSINTHLGDGMIIQGTLCKRNHDDGTGHSLRYKQSRSCVRCDAEGKWVRRKEVKKPVEREVIDSPTINQGDLVFAYGRPLEEMFTRAFEKDDYYVRTV